MASEVFPLERAVTPFSEYKLRLGIARLLKGASMCELTVMVLPLHHARHAQAIMIEPGIEPKTADAATWPGSAQMALSL